MTLKVSEINGSLKVFRIPNQYKTVKEYLVVLFRGSEERLLDKLEGDITNLVTFCDNGFKFEDMEIRHFGGTVNECWVTYNTNSLTGQTSRVTSYATHRPSDKYSRAYKVSVYID